MNAMELMLECYTYAEALAQHLQRARTRTVEDADVETRDGRIVRVVGLRYDGIGIDHLAAGLLAIRATVPERLPREAVACLEQAESLLAKERPAALVALVRACLWGCAPADGPKVHLGISVDGRELV